MKHVEIYDPATASRQTIPVAELSPHMVRGRMADGSVAWIDATKVKLGTDLIHPQLNEEHKRILQHLKHDLDEVLPCTLAEWEHDLRCDQNLHREIHIWRWIAHTFKRLTASVSHSLPRKQDIFQLCVRWTMTKETEAVLATTSLQELSQEEARTLLNSFATTDAAFFGGHFAQWFPEAQAIDYSTIKSLEEFNALAVPAALVVAVDWSEGFSQIVYGKSALERLVATGTSGVLSTVALAVDFGTSQLEHLLAAVLASKGSYEWNGKVHHRTT